MPGYLEIADGQVGYRGDGNNHVKYWLDLAPSLNGQPWCACFVTWCLVQAGQIAAIGGSPMYSCTQMMNRAKARGQWASNPVAGALAIFDFNSGSPAHVEFVVSVGASTNVHIGGNTSGDLVARKTRSRGGILGYWHIDAPAGSIPAGSGDAGVQVVGWGTLTAAAAQTIVGTESDEARVRFGGRARFLDA